MKTDRFGRIVVLLWVLGFLGSAVIQLGFQEAFSAQTVWGYAPGWQREIGFWNVGLTLVLLGLLRSGIDFARHVIPGITILGLCFGVNHLVAALASPGSVGHWAGFGANAAGILCSFAYFFHLLKGERA